MKRIVLFLVVLCVLGYSVAQASVTANSIVTAQTPSRGLIQFLNADTANTTFKTVYTAGANGSKCNALWFDNNDPSATHVIACQIVNGGTKQGGFSATTTSPAAATAFTQISLMPTSSTVGADSDGNPIIKLVSGDTLQCNFQTTVTSGDQLDGHAHCDDF